jgi:hypothetical protein
VPAWNFPKEESLGKYCFAFLDGGRVRRKADGARRTGAFVEEKRIRRLCVRDTRQAGVEQSLVGYSKI